MRIFEDSLEETVMGQARSQPCVSGVAKLSWRNRIPTFCYQNQVVMRLEEKIEPSRMSQRPQLSSNKISSYLSLTTKINQHKNCKTITRGGKKLASCCPGVAFATPCHPMAMGL